MFNKFFGGEGCVQQCWNNGFGYIQNNFFGGKVEAVAENAVVGAIVGSINVLDNCNVISNNYFLADCGAARGTNIAAVAPGVAEALFTTAVGLIAAIPAVIAYNKLTNDIDRMAQRMETFSGELGAILSRQAEAAEE